MNPLFAQTQTASPEKAQFYWDAIRNADANIQAVKANWQAVQTRLPNPSLTDEEIEAIIADTSAQEKTLGIYKDAVELVRSAEATRKHLRIERIGSSQTSQLLFTRVGKQTRADTIFEPQQYAGSTDDQSWRSHTIDFYDWQSSVVLNQVFDVAEDGSVTKNSSWMGERWQAPKHALWRSAGTFAQRFFLPGQSVLASYDPSNTAISEGKNDTIVLETADKDNPNQLHRTTISKKTWRPLSSETILKNSGYVLLRIEATDYKLYGNGIWFPSELNERFGKQQTTQFVLKEVKFNDDVEPAGLLLPAGANLRDERFGEVMAYKITDGLLPTDEKVRKMLGDQKAEAKAMAQAGKGNSRPALSMVAPIAGLFLMAMSCVIWMRSLRKES